MESCEPDSSVVLHAGASESLLRDAVATMPEERDLSVCSVDGVDAAVERLDDSISCLVCEDDLSDGTGMALLEAVGVVGSSVPSLFVTADESRSNEAITAGATDVFVQRDDVDGSGLLSQRLTNVLARGESTHNDEKRHEATAELLQQMYDVTTDRASTYDEKMAQLLELGCEALGLPNAFLTQLDVADGDREKGRQHIVESHGDHELLQPGKSCPLSEAYCRKTIQTDGLLAFENAIAAGWADDPAYEQFDLGCYIGGKVLVNDELYGTLCFASVEPSESAFTELERTIVRLMSKWMSYELERQQATSELEIAETVFEQTQDAIAVVDVTDESVFRVERANPAYGELTARDPSKIAKTPLGELFDSELAAALEARYRDCVEQGESMAYEQQVTVDDETQEWHTKLTPVIEDGAVVSLVETTRDITARKARERELKRKTRAMDEAPVGILISDPSQPDNPAVYVNDQFTEMTGYSESAVLGRNCRFLQGEKTESEPVDVMREAIEEQETVSVELRNYRADDTEFWSRVTIAPIEDADGELTNYVGFQEEITERKEREIELKLRNRAMAEAPIGITIHESTPPWPITYANSGVTEVTGYEPSTIEGEPLSLLTDSETNSDQFGRLKTAFERGVAVSAVVLLYHRDGTPIWGRVSIAPVTNETGAVTHFIGFLQDVTETKERAQEIERRLNEFGELLAEEIQTPLQQAQETLQAEPADLTAEDITTAQRSIELIDSLVEDLSTVHSSSVKPREVFESHTADSQDNA